MKAANAFFSLLLLGSLLAPRARAEITLPEDELAKESVVPKYDNSQSVKNRNVNLMHKIELGGYFGINFSEAIEGTNKVGLNLGYHFNDIHAVTINYAQWLGGLNTQYTSSLFQTFNLDFTRAPALQNSAWVNYEPTLFYGKISVTKKGVLNFNFYPIMGIGETTYSSGTYFGANIGGGYKFYFTKKLALRTDLKFQYSGKPSPFLSGYMQTSQPSPSASQFTSQYTLSTIFDLGMSYLF